MKKALLAISMLLIFMQTWSEDLVVNKNILYSTTHWFYSDINFFNGKGLVNINGEKCINNNENVVCLKIEYEPKGDYSYYRRYNYNSLGQVISEETDYHDYYKIIYCYDDNNRLVLYNEYCTIAYLNDYTCETYTQGKLKTVCTYSWEENVFLIDVEADPCYYKRRFITENGKVIQVHDTKCFPRETFECYYDYEYDGDLLVKITNRHFGDDIISISKIEYYSDGTISKILYEAYRDGKIEYTELSCYFMYDSYGNWTSCKVYRDNKELTNSIKRTIIYQEAPDDSVFRHYVNDTRVRLRKSPDLSGEIITVLDKGDILEVIDEVKASNGSKYGWYEVRTKDNLVGWMYGEYVSER